MGAKFSKWPGREPENHRRRGRLDPPWMHPLTRECTERDYRCRADTVHIPVKLFRQSVTGDQCGADEIEFEYFDATLTGGFRPRCGSTYRATNRPRPRPRLYAHLNCEQKSEPPATPAEPLCARCSQLCTQKEADDFVPGPELSTGGAPFPSQPDDDEESDYANIWES